jgi:hypothetical protein
MYENTYIKINIKIDNFNTYVTIFRKLLERFLHSIRTIYVIVKILEMKFASLSKTYLEELCDIGLDLSKQEKEQVKVTDANTTANKKVEMTLDDYAHYLDGEERLESWKEYENQVLQIQRAKNAYEKRVNAIAKEIYVSQHEADVRTRYRGFSAVNNAKREIIEGLKQDMGTFEDNHNILMPVPPSEPTVSFSSDIIEW